MEGCIFDIAERGLIDVIVHGANCYNIMGAGIALQVRRKYPEAYYVDSNTPSKDRAKLGHYSVVKTGTNHQFFIVNLYTQYSPGPHIDYEALRRGFELIAKDFNGLHIAYPKIGAGIARGDWDTIKAIIDTALIDQNHTYVKYRK